MPGAKGHQNEGGRIAGKLTISPKVKKQLETRDRSTMNRRERIRQGMGISGGTEPPRRNQIRKALESAGNGARHPIAIRGPKEPVGPVGDNMTPRRPQAPSQSSSLRAPVPLGKQLAGRVQSGAIDRSQALKTARQRQTLKKAFGSDWRSKVYAGSGVKEIRQGGPFANSQIRAERSKGLERAKRKLY